MSNPAPSPARVLRVAVTEQPDRREIQEKQTEAEGALQGETPPKEGKGIQVGLDIEQVDVEREEPQGEERLTAHRPLKKDGSPGSGAHPCKACGEPPEDHLIDEGEEGKKRKVGGNRGRTGEPKPQPRLLDGEDQEDDDEVEEIIVHAPAPGGVHR